MPNVAAGLLMYRKGNDEVEFFLVHPGGPFYVRKNEGVWSIPKGIPEKKDEELLQTAQREFFEETGIKPHGPFHPLGSTKLKSGKIVHAWAFEGDWDPSTGIISNLITIAWPPSSKKFIDIPEVDKAEWMTRDQALKMIHPAQVVFLTEAEKFFKVRNR
jgi:predicted NUDIX family NTP pyrophosphohydrolase